MPKYEHDENGKPFVAPMTTKPYDPNASIPKEVTRFVASQQRPLLGDVLDAAYASEINVEMFSFWDGGWDVKLGDHMNGFVAENTGLMGTEAVATWLIETIPQHFPNSDFVKKYLEG